MFGLHLILCFWVPVGPVNAFVIELQSLDFPRQSTHSYFNSIMGFLKFSEESHYCLQTQFTQSNDRNASGLPSASCSQQSSQQTLTKASVNIWGLGVTGGGPLPAKSLSGEIGKFKLESPRVYRPAEALAPAPRSLSSESNEGLELWVVILESWFKKTRFPAKVALDREGSVGFIFLYVAVTINNALSSQKFSWNNKLWCFWKYLHQPLESFLESWFTDEKFSSSTGFSNWHGNHSVDRLHKWI